MPDTPSCFAYLCNNVPSWIASLDAIDRQIEKNQEEIARVPVPATPSPPDDGSGKSIRLKVDGIHKQSGADMLLAPQREDMANARGIPRQEAQLARRKRKTTSVLSENASASCKFRSRSTVIVYYNSEAQKAFETIVRNIGLGRNQIRKDKMAVRMETMSQAGDSDDSDIEEMMLVKGRYKRTSGFRSTRSGTSVSFGPNDISSVMDSADKALEKAQSFCERAAHQFLRDGDCSLEMDGAKERFQEIIHISQRELARSREKEEQALVHAQVPACPPKAPQAGEVTEIELDDRGPNGVELPLPPMRLMART